MSRKEALADRERGYKSRPESVYKEAAWGFTFVCLFWLRSQTIVKALSKAKVQGRLTETGHMTVWQGMPVLGM